MKMRSIFSAVLLTALFAAHPGPASAADKIAVIVSSKEAPFEEALGGIKASLGKQGAEVEFEIIPLEGNAATAGPALQAAKKGGARLIMTLGSLATDAAVREVPDLPVVAALVLHEESLKKGPNVTGVSLEFPLETQVHWLQVLLPSAKTVGVIYNPEENQKRVDAAGRVLSAKGMKLAAKEVRSGQEVAGAVESVGKQADVIWGLADSTAFSIQQARVVLLLSFKNNVPVIGLSPAWVKAGALYCLEWDYADMGAQAAEMAAKILKGAAPSSIPPAGPRKVYYDINLKTAQQMKITFSDKILKGAHQTF